MFKYLKVMLVIAFLYILNSCIGNMPIYKNSKSFYIVFKTPSFKYADMGFISKANDEVKVEIYSNGVSLMRLRVTLNQVCMSKLKCMSTKEFNKKFLNSNYPEDTLYHIFRGEEIFNGKNRINLENGFEQKIGSIFYKVQRDKIIFIDNLNNIKIEVR